MWDKLYSINLIFKFVSQVFPVVNRELTYWQSYAEAYAEEELSTQALASIHYKRFHCLGGSIYSLYRNVDRYSFIRFITALQTISDYLDNLCDRTGITNEPAFRQLHLAITDALTPDGALHDYYKYYPFQQDGEYLTSLVSTCRQEVIRLPAYSVIRPDLLKLAAWYSELQTYKHLTLSERKQKMAAWAGSHLSPDTNIAFWEFAAAAGSTLGIFMLCAAAADPKLSRDDTDRIFSVYFPWICGLHILLDYFIDREEDLLAGDLNFTSYYKDADEMLTRFKFFIRQAVSQSDTLPNPAFSKTVICGLLALYLSDPKALTAREKPITKTLLTYAGPYTKLLHTLCRLLRKCKKI